VSTIDKIAAFEKNFVTVTSSDLGLPAGALSDLDDRVARLPRQQLTLRTVTVLTGLFADLENGMRTVSDSLAGGLGGNNGAAIRKTLEMPNTIFVEPMQQLILLRRCLTKSGADGPDVWSDDGLSLYFDACRYAADLAVMGTDQPDAKGTEDMADRGIRIAASFLLRLSLLNPPHFVHWIARMRLMLRELPKGVERAQPWAAALEGRLVTSFGLSFDEISRFVGLLVLWTLRFKNIEEVFKADAGIALSIDTWLEQTKLTKDALLKFFGRTARTTAELLTDDSLGGPLSVLPFRDRPFVQFADGTYAPVYPPLVAEKLTYDLFWWAGSPETRQERPWQRDWGDLVELYVVGVLEQIAHETGCGFKADLRWDTKQIDAAMWMKGHVALFEISAGMMTDAAAHSGDALALTDGLYRTLVRSKSGAKEKNEAVAQVARDAKAVLAGELKGEIPVETITRVYPVVIAIDRRVRVPGLRFWFDKVFADEMKDASATDRARTAALAVLDMEDLETAEQLIRQKHDGLNGTPRGLIRLLRMWEMTREKLPKTGVRAGAWFQMVREFGEVGVNERLKAESDKWWAEVTPLFKSERTTGST